MVGFQNKVSFEDLLNISLARMDGKISPDDINRISEYRRKWNFFEGYHWQEFAEEGKNEVTLNYCRAFVNKYVDFEFGVGFSIKMNPDVEEAVLPFLNEVWEDNNKQRVCQLIGQAKSVTGDGWAQVVFDNKFEEDGSINPNFYDPYDEYDKGRIRILPIPPNVVFPEYDDFDKDVLNKVTLMYPVKVEDTKFKTQVYRQIWTRTTVEEYMGDDLIGSYDNKYGVIPFFHFKNLELTGNTYGISDLEDIIPLNVELNLKSSDVSEIIEYHSAPITVVFGARVGQLEKGANKVWGGLPKDAKVENLALDSDLTASRNYYQDIKQAMHEVGGIPESALGKSQGISNTSGTALQITMLPLTERTRNKRALTSKTLSDINKLIIKIGLIEDIIEGNIDKFKKGDIYAKDIYQNEIIWGDNLPKDALVEVQTIQLEMKLGLEDREGALKRLGRKDIQQRLKEIDADREANPEIYGLPSELDKEEQELKIESTKNSIKQAKEQAKINKEQGLDVMKRGLNENKAGNDAQVNSGFTNSPVKKQETNS